MTYPSKIDVWVLAVLILVPACLLGAAVLVRSLLLSILCGLVLVLYRLVLLPTNYRFGSEALHIRAGVVRTQIPYQAIRAVSATHSPFASPALSLDRLKIMYGASEAVLVSPRNRAAFLQEIFARVPELDMPA